MTKGQIISAIGMVLIVTAWIKFAERPPAKNFGRALGATLAR